MDGSGLRTLDWVGGADGSVEMVDQTALPGAYTVLRVDTVGDMVAAIQRLSVRGAPAIGVAGALGGGAGRAGPRPQRPGVRRRRSSSSARPAPPP